MDASELSNTDLKEALIQYGITPGPITATTRHVYEKKLRRMSTAETTTTTKSAFTTIQQNVQEYVSTTPKSRIQKVVALEDSPTNTTPYQYAPKSYPADSDLRRRPLYTPGGTLRSAPMVAAKPTSKSPKSKKFTVDSTDGQTKSSGIPWCRILLLLLVLIIGFAVLVYYHMEHDNIQDMLAYIR